MQPLETTIFRLFPTIATNGANNGLWHVLPKISWLKGPKIGWKWPKNLNYHFLLKHRFNHRFPIVSFVFSGFRHCWRLFPMFFWDATIGNDFFPTISDYWNSLCKPCSSTLLCPGLVAMHKISWSRLEKSVCVIPFWTFETFKTLVISPIFFCLDTPMFLVPLCDHFAFRNHM